jgi:hypothetical protein
MFEIILPLVSIVTLVAVVAPMIAIERYYRLPPSRGPCPTLPAQAETEPVDESVLVTFRADTPWGNAGETLMGTLTRLDDGHYALSINDPSGTSQPIPQHAPYVYVQKQPGSHDAYRTSSTAL